MPATKSELSTQESQQEERALTAQEQEQITKQSESFVGQWNELISTTNWEKGQIICQWRADLRDEGSPSSGWSDESWSRLVGGVTPQHVGRLRRTFERFGHVYQEFKGIYWSHFYAALDWDDAEMWLEGSVQNGWSVSRMRKERWETLGKVPEDKPKDSDIVTVETDEETQSLAIAEPDAKEKSGQGDYSEGPNYDEGPDFGDESASGSAGTTESLAEQTSDASESSSSVSIRPFESFTNLPQDVSEAADSFKISIIRHRASEWSEFSKEEMLGLLDALKQLVLAD